MNTFKRITDTKTVTGLRGYVKTDYATLVKIFGEPEGPSSDGKVNNYWIIKFSDGIIGTIYDYKENLKNKGETEWHIGGTIYEPVDRITELVEASKVLN